MTSLLRENRRIKEMEIFLGSFV